MRKHLLTSTNVTAMVMQIIKSQVLTIWQRRYMPSAILKIKFHFHFIEGIQQRWHENQGNCWLMWKTLPLHWIAAGAVVSKQIHPTSFRWKPHTKILLIKEPHNSSQIERSWHFQQELSHFKSFTIHIHMNAIGWLDKVYSWLQAHDSWPGSLSTPKMDQSGFVLCAEQEKLEQVRVVCIVHHHWPWP